MSDRGGPTHSLPDVQEHKEVIAEAMEVMELSAGQQLYAQGDQGSRFYVINEGSVTCVKTTHPSKPPAVFTLNAGQFFGERALLKDEVRQAGHFTFIAARFC